MPIVQTDSQFPLSESEYKSGFEGQLLTHYLLKLVSLNVARGTVGVVGHVSTHLLEYESAQKSSGQDLRQVQFPSYPKYGGLAGHRLTHCIDNGSAKFEFVQVSTQSLFVVSGSP